MNINSDGKIDLEIVKYVATKAGRQRVGEGDVLFNNTNSPALVGKTATVGRAAGSAFSNHMTRLAPGAGMNAAFLACQLHFLWMSGYFLHRCAKHVNQASIASSSLEHDVPFLAAPEQEQHRIVEALDSYLTRLDAAVEGLQRIEANLKRYQASVLKAAVEGRLVPTEAELARQEGRDYEPASVLLERILKARRRRWEEAELAKMKAKGKVPKDDKWKAKYQEPAAPDVEGLPELPEGWCWARAEQICDFITKGTTPKAYLMTKDSGKIPFIKVYNLTFSGVLDFSIDPTFIPATTHLSELARSQCRSGDVLMNIVGPPLGKVAVVPETYSTWNINQAIVRYRPVDGILAQYLSLVLRSELIASWVKSQAKATAGQLNLTLEIVRNLPVPVPPRLEQRRLVSEEAHLSSLHISWQGSVSVVRERLQRLRQAILRWAFEGKLVDQDPKDEPASVLLERIRRERQAADSARGSRRRRRAGR